MNILQAKAEDASELTVVTMKSKAYWGFSKEQLEAWKEELTITTDYIDSCMVYKLELETNIIGYYSFKKITADEVLLDNLFVLPLCIGKGYGKKLMNHFLNRVESMGINTIRLESEPKAEAFYLKFGFKTYDQLKTAIPGRYLAIMNKKIEQ